MPTPFVDELWNSTEEMRKTALHDKNILQDAAYCHFAALAIDTANEKHKKKDKIHEVLEKLKQSYSGYSQKVLGDKKINDVNVIQLEEPYIKQIDLLNQLATGEPVNVIAALHARGKLWKWLGENQDLGPFNTHFKEYLEPHFIDHKDVDKVIEDEAAAGHVDKNKVKEAFQSGMFFQISVSVSIKT